MIERARKATDGRNWVRPFLMLIVPALLILGGGYYWLTSGGSVSTDDAQVRQDIVSVSPQVNGQVVEVFVRNGARVKRGDLLFRIDPQPYRVALEQAQASLAAAKLQTQVLRTTAAGTTSITIVRSEPLPVGRPRLRLTFGASAVSAPVIGSVAILFIDSKPCSSVRYGKHFRALWRVPAS